MFIIGDEKVRMKKKKDKKHGKYKYEEGKKE